MVVTLTTTKPQICITCCERISNKEITLLLLNLYFGRSAHHYILVLESRFRYASIFSIAIDLLYNSVNLDVNGWIDGQLCFGSLNSSIP